MNHEQAYQWLHGDRTEYSGCRSAAEAMNAEIDRLREECARLRDALQQMRRWMPVYPEAADGIVGGREAHAAAMAAANAALKGKP